MTIQAPINLEEFENAVHDWFWNATGLQTVWQRQSAPQIEYPFGTLLITSGPVPAAPGWERSHNYDGSRPLGQEIEFEVRVPCSFTVSCQAYVGKPEANDPTKNAMAFMTKAQTALSLPSFHEAFRAANISVIRPEGIQNLSEVIEDAFVSRANMDVIFGASLEVKEYMGYIAKVQAVSTQLGIDEIFGDV